jgi:putative ABC transport system permease protein
MMHTFNLALRNLLRYRRRTFLTALLITFGVVALLMFASGADAFKKVMIGQITDSNTAHFQIHKRGYVAATDSIPLNLNLLPNAIKKTEDMLDADPAITAYSTRLKFGAMLSNFTETTSIRLNGINPEDEIATVPNLAARIAEGDTSGALLQPGEVLLPGLLAKGMGVKPGDPIVLVVTNRAGSVNAGNFTVRASLDPVTGPGGRDGYIHIDDARSLLRMDSPEAMEIAIRVNDINKLDEVTTRIQEKLDQDLNSTGKSKLELHTWSQLVPFSSVIKMIDLMTLFIRIMLGAIVLVSVMNVMLMAVYERIREIGTLAAIGTKPNKLLALYIGEGLLLGLLGATAGIVISLGLVGLLQYFPITFTFSREHLVLSPVLSMSEIGATLALAVIVSGLASLQPAWRAAYTDPIKALRHV